MSYPTLMYRCPGAHFAHDGHTYDYCAAADEEQGAALAKQGWSLTLVGAVEAVTAPRHEEKIDDDAAVSRDELEEMATELGIKFDGRTSDAGLLKKINAALAEGE